MSVGPSQPAQWAVVVDHPCPNCRQDDLTQILTARALVSEAETAARRSHRLLPDLTQIGMEHSVTQLEAGSVDLKEVQVNDLTQMMAQDDLTQFEVRDRVQLGLEEAAEDSASHLTTV